MTKLFVVFAVLFAFVTPAQAQDSEAAIRALMNDTCQYLEPDSTFRACAQCYGKVGLPAGMKCVKKCSPSDSSCSASCRQKAKEETFGCLVKKGLL